MLTYIFYIVRLFAANISDVCYILQLSSTGFHEIIFDALLEMIRL